MRALPDRYVPLNRRRLTVTAVFAAVALVFAAEIVADVSNARYLDHVAFVEDLSAAQRAAHDGLPGILAALDVVAWMTAAIVFIAWLHAAYRYTDVVAPDERRYAHAWAIGAWFVPILNLWRPKQVVNDVWRAATDELPGALPLAWWLSFLLSGWASPVRAEGIDLHAAAVRAAVGDSFAVISAVLAIVIVSKMTDGLGTRAAPESPRPESFGRLNADVVAPGTRRYGHGWAIGSWFVPILNLWRPKQIVNDVWRGGGRGAADAEPGALLGLWWAAFIISNWLANVSSRTFFGDQTPEELRNGDIALTISDGIDIVGAILAILVVRAASDRLDTRARSLPEPSLEPSGEDWQAPERPAELPA